MIGILTTRRICQGVFLVLFLWFCLATTLGSAWWQLRGWPVNWLMELDPLVGLGTLLSTGTIYKGLLWGVVTLVLTIFLGRFFCGWLCPMGTLQHLTGYAAHRFKPVAEKVRLNRYHSAQRIKYWILVLIPGGSRCRTHRQHPSSTEKLSAAVPLPAAGCSPSRSAKDGGFCFPAKNQRRADGGPACGTVAAFDFPVVRKMDSAGIPPDGVARSAAVAAPVRESGIGTDFRWLPGPFIGDPAILPGCVGHRGRLFRGPGANPIHSKVLLPVCMSPGCALRCVQSVRHMADRKIEG